MESYPVFENEYVTIRETEVTNNFSEYLNFTDNLVDHIQHNSNDRSEIPLSFYPIAKNIRIPSSYMAANIMNNRSSYIDNMARTGEADFWNNYKEMGDWFPWLWARGRVPENSKNIDGWKFYFDSFTDSSKRINNEFEGIVPPEEFFPFFVYLSCIKYTFQLNAKYLELMNEYKQKMAWPTSSKILAVQIRRGDSCNRNCSVVADRPFFHLDEYIKNIEKMILANNYEYIYVSTDSDEEIGAIQKLRPEWKILSLPIDRSQFFRLEEKAVDIEVSCTLDPNRIPFIVDSGIADIYFISLCQGYIATNTKSEFSRCGWYLQMVTQRKYNPYINMNADPVDLRNKDMLLLF
jgi:hypothetical protein